MFGLSRAITKTRAVVGNSVAKFSSWKVGDVVPVNFIKDKPAPKIKDDKEYPAWVAALSEPLPTKAQLLAKYNDASVDNKTLSVEEIMRLKRLVTLGQIKDANLLAMTK
jgi:hypothetical protein